MRKNRIKELRKAQNLTLKNLVELLAIKGIKVNESQLSKFEKGTSSPRSKMADEFWAALAEIFSASEAYLRGFTKDNISEKDIAIEKEKIVKDKNTIESFLKRIKDGEIIYDEQGNEVSEQQVTEQLQVLRDTLHYMDKSTFYLKKLTEAGKENEILKEQSERRDRDAIAFIADSYKKMTIRNKILLEEYTNLLLKMEDIEKDLEPSFEDSDNYFGRKRQKLIDEGYFDNKD